MKLIKSEKHQIRRLYGYEISTRGGYLARLIAYHPLLMWPVIGIMTNDDKDENHWSIETWKSDGSYFSEGDDQSQLDLSQDRLIDIYNRFNIMGPSNDRQSQLRNDGFGNKAVFPNGYVGFKYVTGRCTIFVAMLDDCHVISDDGKWFQVLFNVQTEKENIFFLCDSDGDIRRCTREPDSNGWSFEEIGIDLGMLFHDITYPSLNCS